MYSFMQLDGETEPYRGLQYLNFISVDLVLQNSTWRASIKILMHLLDNTLFTHSTPSLVVISILYCH